MYDNSPETRKAHLAQQHSEDNGNVLGKDFHLNFLASLPVQGICTSCYFAASPAKFI